MKLLLYRVLCCFLLAGCTQRPAGTSAASVPHLQTPVEGYLRLDSTEIGASTIISGLDVPWDIAWGPDNWIWVTEQGGTVSKVNPATGEKKVLIRIKEVWRQRSTGLLGLAVHPELKKFPFVYVAYTTRQGTQLRSRLARYTYAGDSLSKPLTLLEVTGNTGHNGSRLAISPDNKLIWATGDAAQARNAQDLCSLNGKVLRLNLDGSVPADNPIPGSPVWSWGYRNMQGLAYGPQGLLYTSEHGDASDDEINLIRKGGNYGWPVVTGFCDTKPEQAYCQLQPYVMPLKAWTPVIAPAGLDFYASAAIPEWQHSLLLTTLKDADLRVLKLNPAGKAILSEKIYFDKVFGRLRDLCISPAGDVYLATSNRDWNPGPGFPKAKDDRIIRIFPIQKQDRALLAATGAMPLLLAPAEKPASATNPLTPGRMLYNQYCVSCHKPEGQGIAGTFPPLAGAEQVLGDKEALIRIVLKGMVGPLKVKGQLYNQQMPAFSFLSDRDLAEVLSFIRSDFGNTATAITQADVARVRAAEK